MHILYIHQHFATPESASGTRSFVFSKKLVEEGHSVTVITSEGYLPQRYRDQKRFQTDGVNVVNITTGYGLRLSFRTRILSFLRFIFGATIAGMKIPADLVYATSTPLTVAVPAMAIKALRRIPFVFELRDLWPGVPMELGLLKNSILIFFARTLERVAYRFAERIVCISEGISRNVNAPEEKKVVIPTGCDLSGDTSLRDDRWKREAGISAERLFVLAGAIGEANEPDYLIEAARYLQARGRNEIAVALIGAGSARDRIRRLKEKHRLENVHFFNPVPKHMIHQILAAADGGLILHGVSRLYRETAMPNKFFDYISAGLPIIFNFEGPLKEQILRYKAGYYVDHRKPEELSDILEMLSCNHDERIATGKNSRRMAEECFDQKKLAKSFVRALGEIGTKNSC